MATVNKIRQQVNRLLSDASNRVEAKEFLSVIRDNWHIAEDSIEKHVRIALTLVIIFELLARAAVSEVSISGFKLTDLSLLQKLLPLGFAYLAYQVSALYSRRRLMIELHDEMVKSILPGFHANNLGYYAHPPQSSFNTEQLLSANTQGWLSQWIHNLSAPIWFVTILGPPTFQIYAYYRLFDLFGFADVLLWLSLAVTAALTVQAFLFFIAIDPITRPAEYVAEEPQNSEAEQSSGGDK